MSKIFASAIVVVALAVTTSDRLSRPFQIAFRFMLPNRGERRAQGNYERIP